MAAEIEVDEKGREILEKNTDEIKKVTCANALVFKNVEDKSTELKIEEMIFKFVAK